MEYEGLSQDDLDNVRALNRAWLELDASSEFRRSAGRVERLATTPFLLFSFCEDDDARWTRLLDDQRQQDLLGLEPAASESWRQLQAAGLAFLWELARRNGYVARIVSGAPLSWCEHIASATLVRVLDCARYQLVEPRFEDDAGLRRRLLVKGSASEEEVRVFAQIAALHALLTKSRAARYERLPAAACRMPAVTQVADEV